MAHIEHFGVLQQFGQMRDDNSDKLKVLIKTLKIIMKKITEDIKHATLLLRFHKILPTKED